MPILDQYERTYSAPPEPIGHNPDERDYDEYTPPETDEEEFDHLWKDLSGVSIHALTEPEQEEDEI